MPPCAYAQGLNTHNSPNKCKFFQPWHLEPDVDFQSSFLLLVIICLILNYITLVENSVYPLFSRWRVEISKLTRYWHTAQNRFPKTRPFCPILVCRYKIAYHLTCSKLHDFAEYDYYWHWVYCTHDPLIPFTQISLNTFCYWGKASCKTMMVFTDALIMGA